MAKSRARKLADIIVGAGIDIDGNLTFDGGSTSADLTFADNDKANFGDASDLQIWHDGSNSYIRDSGDGDLQIRASNLLLTDVDGTIFAYGQNDGAINLYHNGTKKFETTSTGIDVTGTIVTDALESSGGLSFTAADGINISGKESVVVRIDSDDNDANRVFQVISGPSASQEILIQAVEDDGVSLYYDNSAKLATTSTGIDVTGTAVTDGLTVDGVARLDNYGSTTGKGLLQFGNSGHQFIEGYDTGNAGSGSYLRFGYGSTEAMRISSSGNVGIGTTEPRNVSGYTNLQLDGSTSGLFEIYTNGTRVFSVYGASNDINLVNPRSTGAMRLYTNDTERMRIESDGDIRFGSSSNYAWVRPYESSTGNLIISSDTGATGTNGSAIKFRTRGADKMIIEHSGNVGIGTTSPGHKLSFGANIPSDGKTITVYESGNVASGIGVVAGVYRNFTNESSVLSFGHYAHSDGTTYTERMRIDSSGNLLVGLSSSLTNGKLQVAGSIGLSGNTQIRQATNSDGNTLQIFATQLVAGSLNSSSYSYTGGGLLASLSNLDGVVILDAGRQTSTGGRFKVVTTSSSNTSLYLEKNGTYTLYADTGSGRVGIGETSPDGKLHIKGGTATDDASHVLFENTQGSKVFAIGGGASGVTNNNLFFRNVTDNTTPMVITDAGNVGIGTSSPANTLQIGSVGSSGYGGNDFVIGDGTRVFATYLNSTSDAIEFYTNKNYAFLASGGTGNVGIGTASPITKTHIVHSTVINDHHGLLYVQNTASATGSSSNAGINVNNYTGTSQFMQWENQGLRIGSRRLFNGGTGDVIFTAGADSEKMRIKSDGKVGINTTAPTETLTVLGAICSKNGDDDLGSLTTNSHGTVVSSGTLEFTTGYSGSFASGRVFTFTYEATSWKSWIFEIEVASTHRLTTIKAGGYNNNSMSSNIYEVGDAQNAGTLTVTNSGQHNVFTFTLNMGMTHPVVRVKYTQSGGDGAPRMDRMKLVIT